MSDSSTTDKLRAFTVFPAGATDTAAPTHVVIVPSGKTLAPGFAAAKALLQGRNSVRMVGHCATLSSGWPSWVRTADNLSLTELGAYREGDRLSSTRELRAGLRNWTDEIFGTSFSGLAGRRAFYGSAFTRILEADAAAILFVTNLIRHHPGARFHCVDPSWAGTRMLAAAGYGAQPATAPAREKLALVASWCGALLMTHLDMARRFASAAPSLAALRARRASSTSAPKLWLALTPDWPRINRPLIDTFLADPVLHERGIGVILVGNLLDGKRDERDLRRHTRSELWPGIGELRTSPRVQAIDQVAVSESALDLLRSLIVITSRSTGALSRALRTSHDSRFTSIAGALRSNPLQVAKLLTMDIARATEAERATNRFLARHDVRDATIIFSATTHAEYVVPDLLFQRARARTVDFFHGWSGEPLPLASESESTIRSVWARSDMSRESKTQTCLVAGMPRRIRPRARSGSIRNVLILSNYVHRDDLPNLPWAPFQEELLATVPELRAAFGDRFEFRWRPHPADLVDRVDLAAARIADLKVSRGIDLAQDIAWCDALVSTMSTALVEALFAKIPIFGHVLPELVGTPTPTFLDLSRTFFRAGELPGLIAQYENTLRVAPEHALAPEERALRALFGQIGEPISLGTALFAAASPPIAFGAGAFPTVR